MAEPAEKKMSTFMDRKMHVVEQSQLTPVERQIQKQQRIESDPRKKLRSRDRFPFNFRKAHQSHGYHTAGAMEQANADAGVTLEWLKKIAKMPTVPKIAGSDRPDSR